MKTRKKTTHLIIKETNTFIGKTPGTAKREVEIYSQHYSWKTACSKLDKDFNGTTGILNHRIIEKEELEHYHIIS